MKVGLGQMVMGLMGVGLNLRLQISSVSYSMYLDNVESFSPLSRSVSCPLGK